MFAPDIWILLTIGFGASFGSTQSTQQSQSTYVSTGPADPLSTACGNIISYVDAGYTIFTAKEAFDCLKSVPFIPEVALRFIDYYNTTLQFQSTIPYLARPPQGYQQPAVYVPAELENLRQASLSRVFQNEYDFEAAMMRLVISMHDAHVDLNQGILSAFTFASQYEISSASADGVEAPKVYLSDDLVSWQQGQRNISAITHINNEEVNVFLERFAADNSKGLLEPHADWNQLMTIPTDYISGIISTFVGGATFYPGDELVFRFENGTIFDTEWIAYYNNNPNDTGPLANAGDFYNYFVLGLEPASCVDGVCPSNPPPPDLPSDEQDTVAQKRRRQVEDDDPAPDDVTSWADTTFGAFPDTADIVQPGLSQGQGGVITGYFLDDTSTAVLSIPNFYQTDTDLINFSDTVRYFIGNATDASRNPRMSRVLIDLQSNTGGTPLLAFDTFRQFFPGPQVQGDHTPFAGSNRRVEPLADVLGYAYTNYWDALDEANPDQVDEKELLAGDEWIITNRINAATEANFTSWREYSGARTFEDLWRFSETERYNWTNVDFTRAAFDDFSLDDIYEGPQPWQSQDIVILTDALCSSACVLFVEAMTQAGARTVVAGGQPNPGPMQAASGSRGARAYSADYIDTDIDFARGSLENDTVDALLPQRDVIGISTTYAGISLRNQVQKDDPTPMQFKYMAADCRIYYTRDNLFNVSQLWHDASTATWDDPSRCVEGSRGYNSPIEGQSEPLQPPTSPTSRSSIFQNFDFPEIDSELARNYTEYPITAARDAPRLDRCTSQSPCKTYTYKCSGRADSPQIKIYTPTCPISGGKDIGCAGADVRCEDSKLEHGKKREFKGKDLNSQFKQNRRGTCIPGSPRALREIVRNLGGVSCDLISINYLSG